MNLYDILGINLSDLVDSFLERKGQNHPYFSPSDRPLSWQTKGKVVTLDAAIMALHLLAARTAFKGFAGLLASIGRKTQTIVFGSVVIPKAIESAQEASKKIKAIGFLAGSLTSILDNAQVEYQKEAKIRMQSFTARRELYEHALGKKARDVRKTKYVHTRHTETPRQRKPNRRWRSPKSKKFAT